MFSIEALIIAFILLAVVVCMGASVRILREYERAVVFTLGRFQKVKGPGLVLLIPFIQEMVRVDLRIQVIEIPSQDVISHDNVSMKVDAVLYFNVVNPERAIIQVQNYLPATNMLAQTTLRAVLGQHELDEMLSERKKLEFDSEVYKGLQSRRSMRRMEAKRRKVRPLRLRFSQSLAKRRHRLNHAIERSTIHRLGSLTKPLAGSDRLTISVLTFDKIDASALRNIGPW